MMSGAEIPLAMAVAPEVIGAGTAAASTAAATAAAEAAAAAAAAQAATMGGGTAAMFGGPAGGMASGLLAPAAIPSFTETAALGAMEAPALVGFSGGAPLPAGVSPALGPDWMGLLGKAGKASNAATKLMPQQQQRAAPAAARPPMGDPGPGAAEVMQKRLGLGGGQGLLGAGSMMGLDPVSLQMLKQRMGRMA